MSTTPVIPAAPAASAAPVATPAPVVSTATPSVTAPSAPPTTASPAAGAPPVRPNASEIGDAVEWYAASTKYNQDVEAYSQEHPDWKPDVVEEPKPADAPEAAPETKTEDGEPKPADADTPDPDAETFSLDDDPALTPQGLNDLIKGKPERQAFLESDPEFKNALFRMSREHAELAPLKGIFPGGVESAKFAQKTATETVNLKHQFQTAESPEDMARVFDSFASQFVETGADGKPVIDPETGKAKLGEDYYAYHEYVIDRYAESTLAEVEEALKGANLSDAERDRLTDLKLAAKIIQGDLHPSDETPTPDRSGMDPAVRSQIEAAEARAKEAEDKLAGKDSASKKQSRAEVQKQGRQAFFKEAGTRVFQKVDSIVDALRKGGAVIPQWQLDAPAPGKNHSMFKEQVGQAIESALKSDPWESQNMANLELAYMANPTKENVDSWVKAHDTFINTRDHTGKSLLNRIVTGLVKKYGAPQGGAQPGTADAAPNASREPSSSGAVRPVAMTQDQAWGDAQKQLAKEVHGWEFMGDSEKMAQTMARARQLMTRK